jgi:hypothetical protein
MHPRIFRISFVVARNAAAAAIAVAIIASCNMPKPSASEDQDSESGPFATRQQSLDGAGVSVDLGEPMDCLEDGPWYLEAKHSYQMTVADTDMNVNAKGNTPLTVDKNGNVTSGTGSGSGSMEGTSDDCTYSSKWKYSAKVSGTCRNSLMSLKIEELFGSGAIKGTLKCDDQDPITRYFGWPAMNHTIYITLGGPAHGGTFTKAWGTGGSGSKSWTVSDGTQVELVPLVEP